MVTTRRPKSQSAIEAIVDDTRMAQHAEFPFSNEAEQAVLGSILLDSDMFPLITPIVTIDDFFVPRHQYIYEAMLFVHEADMVLDILTVSQKLAELGYLKDSGGDAYLAHLLTNIPSSQNAESYAQIVQNLSAKRMMLKLSEAIKILATSPNLDTNTLIGRVGEVIDEAAAKVASADTVPINTYVGKVLTEIEEAMNPAKRSYITTGLRALDEMLGGYQRQMVYLIAGRTHNGKSSLGYHSVLAAAQEGKRVAL
ncbi:MAG: hypothetical protein KJ043_22010, partial [Anaerolineae bacterium]|nr:hypothetical protein [Anaerolineae bacterium]